MQNYLNFMVGLGTNWELVNGESQYVNAVLVDS